MKFSRLVPVLCLVACATAKDTKNPKSTLSRDCVNFISRFHPTISKHASMVCHACKGLGISPSVEPCCSKSDKAACFASSFYDITKPLTTESLSISGAPPIYTGSANCDAAVSIYASCEASTLDFNDKCFQDQQSCLCSTSSKWAPAYYDNYQSSCLAWASTANPGYYSLLEPNPNGVVQTRKCHSWHSHTATGGSPSNCPTVLRVSPAATVTPSKPSQTAV